MRRHLSSVLVELLVVLAEHLAQALELLWALVAAAEFKGMPGGLMVDLLQPDIGLQHVQNNLVRVPEEAEVHVHIAILALLPGVLCLDGFEEDGLGGLHLVEIPHLAHLHVLHLLCLADLLLGGLPELLHHSLQRADVRRLAHGPILVETLTCCPHLFQLDTQLQVPDHDLFDSGRPQVAELSVLDGRMQSVQCILLFAHIDELLSPLQRILWLLERSH
mmetsp:Transcript_139758/g.354435  ORF Transcript_139758/g.354435 Transcript_139758/m.354435 type:complete len:219 (+) Transcript_139758:3137-3793(+)